MVASGCYGRRRSARIGEDYRGSRVERYTLSHVGIVVADLDLARERLTALLGLEWTPVRSVIVETVDADGTRRASALRMCDSFQSPGYELIEEAPGTPWVCSELSNVHHLAYATTDVNAASGCLQAKGCPLELTSAPAADGSLGFAYHRDPCGVRIEVSWPRSPSP